MFRLHTATINFDFPEKKRSVIFDSVKPDLTSTDRANTTLLNGEELSANIQAKDVVALRAAVNTLLQMVSASEKTIDATTKKEV